MQIPRAYSHADLERAFDHPLDRVSLYRSLLTFNEAGLIHRHINAKGACSYFYRPANQLQDYMEPLILLIIRTLSVLIAKR